jgi:pSer/pThr/pTyr-binding forkhead associated (FHA) protein
MTIGSNLRSITAPNAIPINAWTHLAVTYDGSTLILYVNGAEVARLAVSGTINNGGTLRLGGDNVANQYFQGRMDDVRLYNVALTTTAIQADINTPTTPSSGDILAATETSMMLSGSITQGTTAPWATLTASDTMTSADSSAASAPSDTQTATTEPLTSDYLETAEVTVDQQWKRVPFNRPFTDPVVVAKALSYREAAPAVVEIQGVDTTGFELRLRSWQDVDEVHLPETAGYVVFEQGRYTLADGTTLEAGNVEVTRRDSDVSLAFTQPFRVTPVVMTAVPSAPGGEAISGRPTSISKRGFQFHFLPQASQEPEEIANTISYIAWEPSEGKINGLAFEVGRSNKVRRDQFHTLAFSDVFTDVPIFLADIQATQGSHPLNLRWEHKDLSGIDVKIDEAAPSDATTPTLIDVVGFIMLR